MRSKKKRGLSVNAYFPSELWREVLVKLPVKYILRYRCVSKALRDIIDDDDFISMYLSLQKNMMREKCHVITFERIRGTPEKWNFTIRPTDTFRKSIEHNLSSPSSYRLWNSMDGLILICSERNDGKVRVCNISIRKSFLLPPCPFPNYTFTLGYAPSCSNYKVLGLVEIDAKYSVYTLRDQSWRTYDLDGGWSMSPVFVSTNGAAHFLAETSSNDESYTHIASFDFDAEDFWFVELPVTRGGNEAAALDIFLLNESVAVIKVSATSVDIWVMDGDRPNEQWTLWHAGDSSPRVDELFGYVDSILYIGKTGIFLIISEGKLYSFDYRSLEIKQLHKRSSNFMFMEIYVHSLLLGTWSECETLTSLP